LGQADCLTRDLNELQMALIRLDAEASRVLWERLDGILPPPTPTLPRKRQATRKSGRRSSAA
jgi:hypothetical protein